MGIMTTRFANTEYEMDDRMKRLKGSVEHKMIKFADQIIKEFQHLNKLSYDKILYTVGYTDK